MAAHRSALPPTVRSPRTRRVNRVVLGLIGLLAALGGLAGLAAGFGILGTAARHRSVLTRTADYADAHAWVWAAVAVAGLLLAGLALAWLAVQPRSNRITEFDLDDRPADADDLAGADGFGGPGSTGRGRSTLASSAITDAVCAEIEGYPGVRDVSARLVRERGMPTLLVFTSLDGRTGPGEVRSRIQTEAIGHVRQALDDPGLPARLEFRLARRSRRHVR